MSIARARDSPPIGTGWLEPYLSFFLSFFSFFSFAVSLALLVFALGFLSLLFAMLRGYTG